MSNSPTQPYSSTATTRHCKDAALDDVEFELLLEGAARLDEYYSLQAQFAVLVLGRLGLRRGELTHMRESWIDYRNQMIQIPRQQDCHGARDGDGICGDCRQLAEQRAELNEGLSLDEAIAMQWSSKTDAAARDVYFGHSPRLELFVERFFDRFDEWPVSGTGVNRRLNKAAERADRLDPDEIFPHALRATAATKLAAQGIEMHSLLQHFGWVEPSTAEVYLSRNGKNTARQLDAMQSR